MARCFTQRQIIIVMVATNIVGIIMTLLSRTLLVASLGLFLSYGARCVLLEVIYSYMSENVSERLRIKAYLYTELLLTIGAATVGLVYWLISPWQLAMGLYQLLPNVVIPILMLVFSQETPIQHITQGLPQKSIQIFKRIAELNDVEFTLQEAEIAQVKDQYTENQRQKHDYGLSVIDLLRFDSLRLTTLLGMGLHFLATYQCYGTQMVLTSFAMSNIYLNGSIIGSASIVACLFAFWGLPKLPRTKTILITQLINLLITATLFMFTSCGQGQCSQLTKVLQTTGLFIFFCLGTISYFFFYTGQVEFFPSQMKAFGLLMTAIFARLSLVFVPLLQEWFVSIKVNITLSFAVSSLLSILLTLPFPETIGSTPPQMIMELQYEKAAVQRAATND